MYFIGGFKDFFFDLLDDFENVWLTIIVSVGSDTEVDLFVTLVIIVGDGGAENWIWGCHSDMREEVVVDLRRGEVQVEFLKSFHS